MENTDNLNGQITVIVAENNEMFRVGIIASIRHKKDIKVIDEAKNGSELLFLLCKQMPDVILLNVQMDCGIEILKKIKEFNPNANVVAMVDEKENYRTVVDAMNAYASSCVSKDLTIEPIYEAIVAVHNETFFQNDLINKSLIWHRTKSNGSIVHHQLTEREMNVLKLMYLDLTKDEIAVKLKISPRVVVTAKDNIRTKLNAKNFYGMMKFAVDSKIV